MINVTFRVAEGAIALATIEIRSLRRREFAKCMLMPHEDIDFY